MGTTYAAPCALALAVMSACGNPPPEIAIVSPESGTVITDFEPVDVSIVIRDRDAITAVELYVGGVLAEELDPALLPARGECRQTCTLSIPWITAELAESAHEVIVSVEDEDGDRGSDRIAVSFEDAPAIAITEPIENADLAGVSRTTVRVSAVDRSPLELTFLVDGASAAGAPTASDAACGLGCTIRYDWETTPYAEGPHELSVAAVDPFGRSSTALATLTVADIPYVTGLEVTGEDDGGDALEVEVHLFDAGTDQHLGCSGEATGLEQVDFSDVRYTVVGRFINNAAIGLVPFSSVAGRNIIVRVTEDDGGACPVPPGSGDDSIASTAAFPADDLRTVGAQQFGNVTHLGWAVGRPLIR